MANTAKKVGVFLSFEYDMDRDLHRNFYAQAKRHSKRRIRDLSLKERRRSSEWLEYARTQIAKSDIVIVVVGKDTHNAPGVEKEITIAHQLKKPIFQIRPRKRTAGKVKGAREMIRWRWKRINVKIDDILQENRRRSNR